MEPDSRFAFPAPRLFVVLQIDCRSAPGEFAPFIRPHPLLSAFLREVQAISLPRFKTKKTASSRWSRFLRWRHGFCHVPNVSQGEPESTRWNERVCRIVAHQLITLHQDTKKCFCPDHTANVLFQSDCEFLIRKLVSSLCSTGLQKLGWELMTNSSTLISNFCSFHPDGRAFMPETFYCFVLGFVCLFLCKLLGPNGNAPKPPCRTTTMVAMSDSTGPQSPNSLFTKMFFNDA